MSPAKEDRGDPSSRDVRSQVTHSASIYSVLPFSVLPGVAMAIFAVLVIGLAGCSSADDEFKPRVVIKRAFPAIKDVTAKSLEDADKVLQDDELVLGVEVNGYARAYTINMLTGPAREIVNDDLGDLAIAATW